MARDPRAPLNYLQMFGRGTLTSPRPRRALQSPAFGVTATFRPGGEVPTIRFTGPAAGQSRTRTARRAQYLEGMLQGRVSSATQPSSVKALAKTGAWKAGYLRGAGRRSSKPISGAGKNLIGFAKEGEGSLAGSSYRRVTARYSAVGGGTNGNPGKFWLQLSNGRFSGSAPGVGKGRGGKGRRR